MVKIQKRKGIYSKTLITKIKDQIPVLYQLISSINEYPLLIKWIKTYQSFQSKDQYQ